MKSGARPPITVAIVNDYEIVVAGLSAMLAAFPDRVTVVDTSAGGLPDCAADVALFDTFAGRRKSLQRIDDLAADPKIGRVALYTWDVSDAFASDIETRSVDGVILKRASGVELVDAIERVHRGEPVGVDSSGAVETSEALTEREREVLALVGCGMTNREIGLELYLSPNTVKSHLRRLFAKLEVTNRTQAALRADELRLRPRKPATA